MHKDSQLGFCVWSRAFSVGLLCSLSGYAVPAYQAPLSFLLHTQMDLWGIQSKLWVEQIKPASLVQLYFMGNWVTVHCPLRKKSLLYNLMKEKATYVWRWIHKSSTVSRVKFKCTGDDSAVKTQTIYALFIITWNRNHLCSHSW